MGQATYENNQTHIDIDQAKNWMVCELAGEAAENVLANTPYKTRPSAAYDRKIAKKIAQQIIKIGNAPTQQSTKSLIKDAQTQAHQLMRDNQTSLKKIANTLLEKETLSADEIYEIGEFKR